MNDQERRIHTRVQVTAEVRVSGPSGFENGILKDISKGGARVLLPQKAGNVGDVVEIFISFPVGAEIAVMAEIVRIEETPEGVFHGLRFDLVEPAMQETLLKMLESFLEAKGSTTRRHPRIAHRIPIRTKQPEELKLVLENISLGGLAMICPYPLSLYEDVVVSIPDTSGNELLLLSARVVNQVPVGADGQAHRVGLQFKTLSPAAQACLTELIRQLVLSNA